MSTLLHRIVLSIELGTGQTGTGKVDSTRKFKCTTAARENMSQSNIPFCDLFVIKSFEKKFPEPLS